MTTTFGRRTAAPAPRAPDTPPLAEASSSFPEPDARLAELAASLSGGDPTDAELRDYLRRRRAAIGPWRWLARGLFFAPTAASWLLGVHGLWLAPISVASFAGPMLLKRARLRWAAQLEPKTHTTFEA